MLLPDQLVRTASLRAGRDALGEKTAGGWRWRGWDEFERRAAAVGAALVSAGVRPGQRAGILARSRPEWVEAEFGAFLAGAVVVPLHPATLAERACDLARRADLKIVFAEDPLQAEKLIRAVRPDGPVVRLVVFDPLVRLAGADARGRLEVAISDVAGSAAGGSVSSFGEFVETGMQEVRRGGRDEVDRRRRALRPEDPASVVFTAGATGTMRGAVLTHDNLAFTTETLGEQLGVTSQDRTLLFLPLAHVYPRLLVWTAVRVGFAVAFTEDRRAVLRDAAEVRPDFLITVPRFLEAVRRGLAREVDAAPFWRRALFGWALGAAREREARRREGREVPMLLDAQHRLAERLVRRPLRERLGGRLRFIVSGGAPLEAATGDFFAALGIPVIEGYGMTEGTALTCFVRPGEERSGSVGRPIAGVEVRTAPDGEILFRGRNVMREYLDDPDATAETIDSDGWVRSGDLGIIEDGGFLRITGRKKDIIVTQGGKNVSPALVESLLRASELVRDAIVVGDGRPYLAALIVLETKEVAKRAVLEGIILGSPEEMGDHPAIRAMIEDVVADCNRKLESFQKVRAFRVVPELVQAPPEADPTATRTRRLHVERCYADLIEGIYGPESGIRNGLPGSET